MLDLLRLIGKKKETLKGIAYIMSSLLGSVLQNVNNFISVKKICCTVTVIGMFLSFTLINFNGILWEKYLNSKGILFQNSFEVGSKFKL